MLTQCKKIYLISLIIIISTVFCSCQSSVMLEDEYYIYEDGKVVFALSDYKCDPSPDDDGFDTVSFNLDSNLYQDRTIYEHNVFPPNKILEDRETLATKRGIAVGSTIREFADAYNGCNVEVDAVGSIDVCITDLESLKKCIDTDDGEAYIFMTTTTDNYKYELSFKVENSIISNIGIRYWNYMD